MSDEDIRVQIEGDEGSRRESSAEAQLRQALAQAKAGRAQAIRAAQAERRTRAGQYAGSNRDPEENHVG
jgi:hypothetical protein